MSQVLYRKWRPQRWDQVVGQDHVVASLRNAVIGKRLSHAFLFAGPRGTGKTSTARLLAKAVNCLDEDPSNRPCDACEICLAINQGRFLDLIEIDAASNTSVEDVRDLREKINFSPNQGRFKVYIIDEVHMLSTAAFNALLKTLEEPPSHAIFVLATTEVHKIPSTVLSRCQRHEFRRIPVADIVAHLVVLAAGEALDVEKPVFSLVARQSTGSLRDAISLIDQLASTEQTVTLELAQTVLGTAASQAVLDMVDALVSRQVGMGLDRLHQTLDGGTDPRQFARQIVDYLRGLLLVQMDNADLVEASADVRALMAKHADAFSPETLLQVIRLFNQAATELRRAWQPSLPLELALVEAIQAIQRQTNPVGTGPGTLSASTPNPATGYKPETTPGTRVSEPPPAESPTASAPDSSTPNEGLSLKRILGTWDQVLVAVCDRNPQTHGLLKACKPLGLKDGTLILGFASELLKSKMEKRGHMEHTLAALQGVLGSQVPVQCVVSAASGGGAGKGLDGMDSNGLIAVALRDLGGEIVDIQ